MVKSGPVKPKGLPPVWNLHQRRNINFVGRQQYLLDIAAALAEKKHRPQALTGGGGCGKTALAIEYAYQHQEQYDIVWWVRAESAGTIAADLAALAPKLARAGQVFDGSRQACNAVLNELQKRDRWLLIFDNARKPDDLSAYLPALRGGDVLLTNRSPFFAAASGESRTSTPPANSPRRWGICPWRSSRPLPASSRPASRFRNI
jgi:hypothetical protein